MLKSVKRIDLKEKPMDINTMARKPVVRKIVIGLAGAIAFIALLGFLVLPPIVRSVIEKQATKALHRKTTVASVRINPFTLSVTVRGLAIADRETGGPFLAFDELFVDAQMVSAWHRGPVLREVTLRGPRIAIVRKPDGRYNFSDLVDEFTGKPSPPESKPLRFSINNIRIENGAVDFDDRPKKTKHAIRRIDLSVPFVSNLPYYVEKYVQPAFSATVNGTPVALTGKTRPFSNARETSFAMDVRDIDLPYYLEYSPVPLKFKIPSGAIDTKVTLFFTQRKDVPPTIVLAGALALKNFRITDLRDAPVLSVPRLDVPLVSASPGPLRVKLGDVLLTSPELHLARDREGKLTLLSLLPGGDGKTPAEAAGGKPPAAAKDKPAKPAEAPAALFEAVSFRLTGGKIIYEDAAVDGKPFKTTLDNVTVTARDFTTAPGKPFGLDLSLATETRETVRDAGRLTLAPLAAEGEIRIGGIALKKYAPYYAKSVLFDVREGLLDLSARYVWRAGSSDNAVTAIDNLAAALTSLKLRQRGDDADFLQVPRLEVKETAIDLLRRTARIGSVGSARGQLRIVRNEDGKVNLSGLTPAAPQGPGKKAAPKPAAAAKATPSAPAWQITLGKLALDRWKTTWDDQQPEEAVLLTLSPLDISAANLSTAKNSRGKASVRLTLNGTGTAAVSGTVGIDPSQADLSVKVHGIDLAPLQPYFTQKVNIELTGGRVDADGRLSLKLPAGAPAQVKWDGEAGLRGLATLDENGEDFLKWEALQLSGMRIGVNPTSAAIREVSLSGLYSKLVVNPDGTLNVQDIVRKAPAAGISDNAAKAATPSPAAAAPAPASTPTPVSVETVTLQGGTILFTDRHVRPNYTAKLEEVGGRVSGLSSEETKMADVLLRGRLDNHAPLEISGKINPLRNDLFVDLKVDFKDIDLSPMTPYSGHYAGYAIEKGKLSLGLKYLIVKKKLDAGNVVFIDQFNFGEKVDSPDATKLPVRLAVALLKDRNGEIRLDLPVSGSLDDPKFSVWGVIWQIVKNLLVKAATSPFALLGALMGNGEELSYLEFPAGLDTIDAAGETKLKALAKALEQRPALKLDVVGYSDPPADRDALRKATFERKVRAQKIKEMAKQGGDAKAADNVSVTAEEYPKYLLKAYSAESFPKPRNLIGMQKDLPVPEMEKLILTHIEITDDQLRQLAQDRSKRAIDYLAATKQVDPGRIFTVEAKTLAPAKKEKQGDSRIEFVLK
jgi:hypothetical protein